MFLAGAEGESKKFICAGFFCWGCAPRWFFGVFLEGGHGGGVVFGCNCVCVLVRQRNPHGVGR